MFPGDYPSAARCNHPVTFALWWGARRAGLYYTPLNVHLKIDEVRYVLRDCGARILIASAQTRALAQELLAAADDVRVYLLDAPDDDPLSFSAALRVAPGMGVPSNIAYYGRDFLYSSGTTGMPKGIRRPLIPSADREKLPPLEVTFRSLFRYSAETVYLCPSPLYHATGRFAIRAIEEGGSVVVMGKFDAARALELMQTYRITHAHWVPTMFVRMLALPEAQRAQYDLSSARVMLHAAAPCPVKVKDSMIQWWGPILEEYYAGSENAGVTYLDSHDWLKHRGSVGRAVVGRLHILDEGGEECGVGEVGGIYFSGGPTFIYHNDPEKTAAACDAQGRSTYGDLGWVDEAGYLYLSDRRTDLIISGGVNIYPQEVENVLGAHPLVSSVAVVGAPDPEFGETVRAVVQLHSDATPSPELAQELIEYCRERLAHLKCPRGIDFQEQLPRSEVGKLLRRVLKERYKAEAQS